MPVAEGAGPGPGWPRPAQPRAVLGPAPQSSWLAPCLQEDTTRRPQAPGPLETQGDPSLLRHLDMPTWSREGVLPPQLHLRSISAPAPPPPLQLRGGPGLAPCVQATTTPHPREGRGVTPPWGSHSCSLRLCGSGGNNHPSSTGGTWGDPTVGLPLLLTTPLWEWRLRSGDRTELGPSDPQALCQPRGAGSSHGSCRRRPALGKGSTVRLVSRKQKKLTVPPAPAWGREQLSAGKEPPVLTGNDVSTWDSGRFGR